MVQAPWPGDDSRSAFDEACYGDVIAFESGRGECVPGHPVPKLIESEACIPLLLRISLLHHPFTYRVDNSKIKVVL